MARRTNLGPQTIIRKGGPAADASGGRRYGYVAALPLAPVRPRLAIKGEAAPVLGYDLHDPHYPLGPATRVSVPDLAAGAAHPARDVAVPASMVPIVDDLVMALVDRERQIEELKAQVRRDHAEAPPAVDNRLPAALRPEPAEPALAAAGDPGAPYVLAVGSRKGGIGKTTTAVNLAVEMAARGVRTLLLDLDPQGHAALGLGVEEDSGATSHDLFRAEPPAVDRLIRPTPWPDLSLIPADRAFAGGYPAADLAVLARTLRTRPLARRFDLVLLDLPPTLDLAVKNGLFAADGLLIPLLPHPLALDGAARFIHFFRNLHAFNRQEPPRIGIVPMMFDRRIGLHSRVLEQAERRFGAETMLRSIRVDIRLAEAFAVGRPIRQHAPRSRGSLDFHLLAEELTARWLPGHPSPGRAIEGRRPVRGSAGKAWPLS
ncbi:MAG: ParA family protein [Rhodospirillaceae bacterium]